MDQPRNTVPSRNTPGDFMFLREPLGRLGTNPEKRMAWLLRFNKLTLNQLTKDQWDELRQELWAFSKLGMMTMSHRMSFDNLIRVMETSEPAQRIRTWVTQALITQLQVISQNAVAGILHQGGTTLPPVTITQMLMKVSDRVEVQINPSHTAVDGPFIIHLAELLRTLGIKLAICKSSECPTQEFLMIRYKQTYCSNRCRSRDAMRKMRTKQKEEKQRRKTRAKGGAKHGTKGKSRSRNC